MSDPCHLTDLMNDIQSKIEGYFAQYHLKHFKKGRVLVFPDDEVQSVFYIVKGSVKQYGISQRGDEVILNLFKPGAFFPMANVINDMPAKYMLEVEADADIRVVPKDEAILFLKKNPDIVYDLLSRVYRGTEGMLGRLEHLMISSAKERLIYELLIEAKRFGEKSENGAVTININETSIGQRAGLSRETVNREVRKLKAKDLIRVKRNTITIPNIEELENLLA